VHINFRGPATRIEMGPSVCEGRHSTLKFGNTWEQNMICDLSPRHTFKWISGNEDGSWSRQLAIKSLIMSFLIIIWTFLLELCNFLLHFDLYFCGRLIATWRFNPLNAELNPICHLLALLGAHRILHVSRIRVNLLRPMMVVIVATHIEVKYVF